MRIVIDMQGAQTASRTRGIGRYSLAFAEALVRNRGPHDVFLALNGLFPDTIMPIRNAFASLLPRDRIRVWEAPGPLAAMDGNAERRARAALIREAFLASLDPDIVHVTSLFEGFVDDAVVTVGALASPCVTSVTLYDFIPLHDPDRFLKPNPVGEAHYRRSLAELGRADLLLAISDFTARDATRHVALPSERVVNVSSAHDTRFGPRSMDTAARDELRRRFRIPRDFILTSGTVEPHKNLDRLFVAFAQLPAPLRASHCIVLVGRFVGWQGDILAEMAARAGLRKGELILTGYVSDEDLVGLYNACDLMVFPSLDEGFGLPALEAMACGAPTIGSRAASIPEIIGREDALFDPSDVADISRLLMRGLEDAAFRASLAEDGLRRAASFSWDTTAKTALAAMETAAARSGGRAPAAAAPRRTGRRPTLAFVSPLPPDKTGIADYSAELLPALAAHCDITLISRGHRSFPVPGNTNIEVRSPDWLRKNFESFDWTLYQVGNSPFHDYMLDLMKECPGTIVLHDFYLSSLLAWKEDGGTRRGAWTDALYESHGYTAVRDRYRDPNAARVHYPANLDVLRAAVGVIVHSEHSKFLARRWAGPDAARNWQTVPHLRTPVNLPARSAARKQLRLPQDSFVVASFGAMDPTKLNHRLLRAFCRSHLARTPNCYLAFVGERPYGEYATLVDDLIREYRIADRVRITQWAPRATFEAYLAAADAAVQLRANSRGETSGTILDCLAAGLPTIINAHGSAAEIPPDVALVLDDDFDEAALVGGLERLFEDRDARRSFGEAARARIREAHSPAACAAGYVAAIEGFARKAGGGLHGLAESLADIDAGLEPKDIKAISAAIAWSIPLERPDRQLFLDVTETMRSQRRTGIERVARALVLALIDTPPTGYRVEPVYLSDAGGRWHYRTARQFTMSLIGCPPEMLSDDIAEPGAGDVVLTLDLTGRVFTDAHANGLYADLRCLGARLYSIVYDLLPASLSQHFPEGAGIGHEEWLAAAAAMDGVIGISRAVAADFRAWLAAKSPDQPASLHVGWFHLGADIDNSDPTRGMPADATATLAALAARPTFLMVGTIEPRKGHLQAIAAFDRLWQAGIDANLVIVGAEGWLGLPADMRRTIPEIVARLAGHPERDRRLFWLNGISDEYLEQVYAASTCLIAASEGEGFGLPLIEAARHQIPILARDLPVFREVAGAHAAYFSGLEPADLAAAIEAWLALHRADRHPRSEGMPWITWRESARRIADLIAAWDGFPAAAAAAD